MRSDPSFPSPPGSFLPEVVAPDRVLSMSQIQLNFILMLKRIVWNRTVFDIETVLTLNWIVWNRNVFDIETALYGNVLIDRISDYM